MPSAVTEARDWLGLLQGLLVPVLGYGAWILRDIRNQLRTLNGRMIKIEEWRGAHDKQDDERHEDLTAHVDRLSDRRWRGERKE